LSGNQLRLPMPMADLESFIARWSAGEGGQERAMQGEVLMLWLEEQERRTREARLLVSRPEEVFKELRSYGAQAKANHLDGDKQLEKSLLERGDPLIDLGLACYGSDEGVVGELAP
jgi:hypothetical protein